MRASANTDNSLLNEAREITGLAPTATVDDVLRYFVESARRRKAWAELEGLGWDGPHYSRPTFETLASEFRALTIERHHTPSEELMRDGRLFR